MSFDLSQRKLLYTVNNFGGLSNCAPRVDLDLQSSILVLVEMMVNEKQEWRRGMGKRSSNENSDFIPTVVAS